MPKNRKPRTERQRLAERIRARLRRQSLARLEMSVMVLCTGIVGFLVSVGLLAMGVSSMAIRYALAVIGAYAVFLGLIRLWVEYHKRRLDGSSDAVDLVPDLPIGVDRIAESLGQGGGSGGGGASGDWDATGIGAQPAEVSSGGGTASTGQGSGGGGLDLFDLDDGWIVIVPIVLIIGGIVAALLVIWSAPALLAEVVLDVLLVSGLYRRLKNLERRSWLLTAVRKTWIPVAVVTILLVVAGLIIQSAVPEADSMGDVFRDA